MKTKPKANIGPVTVALPNTADKKMEAIVNLSKAMQELATAINGVNVSCHVSNCTLIGDKVGITFQPE